MNRPFRAALAALLTLAIAAPGVTDPVGSAAFVQAQKNAQGMSALDALALAAKRRVDFVMIGDSNQLKDARGWGGAMADGMIARFGMYATPIYAAQPDYVGSQGGTSSGVGYPATPGATTGADTTLGGFAMPPLPSSAGAGGSNGANTYGYASTGTVTTQSAVTVGNSNGAQNTGVNLAARWRLWASYGTFASGSGSFVLGARNETSPYNGLGSGAAISTNTGAETQQLATFDVAANASRTYPIGFKWAVPGGTAATAPFIFYWSRAENLDADTGISVHTLYGVGGQSLYDMAYQLMNGWTMAQLTTYFAEVRRLQIARGYKPIVVV